jgi:hypothetical protein
MTKVNHDNPYLIAPSDVRSQYVPRKTTFYTALEK